MKWLLALSTTALEVLYHLQHRLVPNPRISISVYVYIVLVFYPPPEEEWT